MQFNKLQKSLGAESGIDFSALMHNSGDVQQDIVNKLGESDLYTNAGALRSKTFDRIQEQVVQIRRRVLNGVSDLISMGLTMPADLGETLVGFEDVNEFRDAAIEMSPGSNQNNDTSFALTYVPVPIYHQSFEIPWRQQGFDIKRTQGFVESGRKVSEAIENTLFNGADIAVNFNGTLFNLFGYTTHPNRATFTISDWTLLATTGVTIVNETIAGLAELWNNQGGVLNDSVMMYVSNDIAMKLEQDHSEQKGSDTILDRLLRITQIKGVKAAEFLADKTVALVEMDSRTVKWVLESDVVSVPHQKINPTQPQVFTTFAAGAPLLMVDSDGKVGFAIGSI